MSIAADQTNIAILLRVMSVSILVSMWQSGRCRCRSHADSNRAWDRLAYSRWMPGSVAIHSGDANYILGHAQV